jgi:two-component system alkaline phosphatase synthesis response regulator PhoP
MIVAKNIIRDFKELKKESFSIDEILDVINNYTYTNHKCDIKSNGIIISPEMRLVYVNGKGRYLPKKVFNLLYYLIENKNKIVSREQILSDVWGNDVYVGHRTIDVHIRKIRRIGIDSIKTLKTVGFSWIEK